MKIEKYQEETKRTMPDLGIKLNMVHMALGLGSELSELQEAIENEDIVNVGEELTDIMWYLSNYHNLRGLKLKEGNNEIYYSIMDLTHCISEIQDVVKKHIAYDREINVVIEKELLQKLSEILYSMYKTNDLIQSECLQKNIDKLYERFPDGYSNAKALNRDVDAERKILEGYYGNQGDTN